MAAPATVSGLLFIPVTLEGVMPLYFSECGKADEGRKSVSQETCRQNGNHRYGRGSPEEEFVMLFHNISFASYNRSPYKTSRCCCAF
ncbi:hypothetical protein AGR8A_Lc40189 [Agrobacterium fabrum str. J-07]|nr:hypothetical protein AGR8A_Lc40189 [Agrobacterium fabrum str. J-07]